MPFFFPWQEKKRWGIGLKDEPRKDSSQFLYQTDMFTVKSKHHPWETGTSGATVLRSVSNTATKESCIACRYAKNSTSLKYNT